MGAAEWSLYYILSFWLIGILLYNKIIARGSENLPFLYYKSKIKL